MGFQETFNARVMPAADRAFGITASLTHGQDTIDLTLLREQLTQANRYGLEQYVHAETAVFVAKASELVLDAATFLPAGNDVIQFSNAENVPQNWGVFPLVDNRCYRPFDNTETRLRIYAVRAESFRSMVYHGPTANDVPYPNTLVGIMSQRQEDGQAFGSVGGLQVAERVRMRVVANPGEIVESGTCTVLGGEWAIEEIPLAVEGLIELQLRRQPIKRHHEARRR